MDLEKLLAAVRAGESWAGPALVTLLLPMLTRYATDIGGDLSDADREEAIETAVLQSVDRIEKYNSETASFPTWVRGFVKFAVADCRRRRARNPEVPLDAIEEAAATQPASGHGHDQNERLVWPLLKLEVTDQVIVSLRDYEGLSYEACAERIGGGVTAGACRVRHFRAIRRLRELLSVDPDFQHYFEGENS